MEYHDLNLHWVWDFKNEAIQGMRQKGFQVKNFVWKDRWIIIITTQNFNHWPHEKKIIKEINVPGKWNMRGDLPSNHLRNYLSVHVILYVFFFPFGFPIKSQHRLEISSLRDVFGNISTSTIRAFFLASNLIPMYCLFVIYSCTSFC